MEIYTLLLVDDEAAVTEAILQKIDWRELGFSVVGCASNGVKALELAEREQPDVVMTDIKMPYMDGLELARRLRKEYPATKILFFTGFDEFEYAREAVHLEAEEYILKPLSAAELREVFTRLHRSLEEERGRRRDLEKLRAYYRASLPLLQSNFYISLIEGRITPERLGRYLADYQISLPGPVYCCVVIHTSEHRLPEKMTPVLLSISVQKHADEHLGKKWNAALFSYLQNTVMIVQLRMESEVRELTDDCDRFCRSALRLLGAVVTVGIGRTCRSIGELPFSYGGAREAVSYRVLYGSARSINIREIAPQESGAEQASDERRLHLLFKEIHIGTPERIKEAAAAYVEERFAHLGSVGRYELAAMELLGALSRFASDNGISLWAQERTETGSQAGSAAFFREVPQMDLKTLRDWLTETALRLSMQLSAARSHTSLSFVERARKYVRDHYAEPGLTLDAVCGELGLSSSYFSALFKKETGETFIACLTDYRLQQAARMMVETNAKNYEIAAAVGYTDSNYFSYVFRKSFGISPSQYRAAHTGGRGGEAGVQGRLEGEVQGPVNGGA